MQGTIPIADIISATTANLVLAGLAISVVGALVAVTVRHYTSQNWHPEIQDIWYFCMSAGISVALVLFGYDTGTILTATTGINTPMALFKTAIDKYSDRKDNTKIEANKAEIAAIKAKLEAAGAT
jgi:uncharacterized membrane protein YfcA